MPLSELYRLAKRRVDSNQDFEAGNSDVYELVWENGQISTTQGQSSRVRKDPNSLLSHCFPTYTSKPKDKDLAAATRTPKFGTFPDSVPIADEVSLSHHHHGGDDDDDDDDMIPWLNYPMDQADYCPEFLPELSGISPVNDVPKPNNGYSEQRTVPRTGGSQWTPASPTFRSRPTDNTTNNTTVVNFSHFSRPIALARANLSIKDHNNNNNNNNTNNNVGIGNIGKEPEAVPDGGSKNNTNACESTSRRVFPSEPVVASSSVCSGNSVERASADEPGRATKKRFRDAAEDSECHSEDVEEESVGVKKMGAPRASGSKRTRAAEVHNLSERKRRDRINEKMRALQELIPNCNKVDKASMLDEAIEYLKTLQLQVQIMSMGAGLCMPPMMLQHMHHHHGMAHFSPMGVGMGMGMGMGFGMGIPDIMQRPPPHQVYGVPTQGLSMPIQRPLMRPAPFVTHPYASNTSAQCQSVNEVFEKSGLVQNNVQQSDPNGTNPSASANGNDAANENYE